MVQRSRGFTLVEVIIVIVIIGVLATLALPRVAGQIESSRSGEAVSMLAAIKRAAEGCVQVNDDDMTGCMTFDQLDIEPPSAGALFGYYAAVGTDNTLTVAARRREGTYVDKTICMQYSPESAMEVGYGFSEDNNPYSGIASRLIAQSRELLHGTECTESFPDSPM